MSDDLVPNLVDNTQPPAPKGVKKPPVGMPATIRIILEENDDIPPTGLYLGHNGRGYMLKPGEPVDVPYALKEILDNAVMSAAVVDPTTNQIIGQRERRRYNYTILNG